MIRMICALISMIVATTVQAQSTCRVPPTLPEAQSEPAPPGAVRNTAITGHILALSWSPQFCRTRTNVAKFETQCGDQKFGFILHGLWPDGPSRNDPQWCKVVPVIPRDLVRASFCATPSVTLQQHEWAKHGSCMTSDPATYFQTSTALFAAIKVPDMDALSRRRPTVGGFIAAFIAVNPGLRADMLAVSTGRGGWLEDVRLCLDKTYHTATCPADIRGAPVRSALKIWRNMR